MALWLGYHDILICQYELPATSQYSFLFIILIKNPSSTTHLCCPVISYVLSKADR